MPQLTESRESNQPGAAGNQSIAAPADDGSHLRDEVFGTGKARSSNRAPQHLALMPNRVVSTIYTMTMPSLGPTRWQQRTVSTA